MPLSTSIAKYPASMLDVLENVCETRHPATIPYPDPKVAKAARFKFYGLVKALVINRHSLADEATRLEFRLIGENRQKPNILVIQYPDTSEADKFYAAVAAKVLEGAKQ